MASLPEHPEFVPDDLKEVTEEVSALLDRGAEKCDSGDFAAGLQILDDLLRDFNTHDAATVQDAVAKAWVNKGNVLSLLERHEEALRAFDKALQRLMSTRSPQLQVVLATAMVNKAAGLKELGRTWDAIAVLDDLDHRFGTAKSPSVDEAVATGMFNRGNMLGEMRQNGRGAGCVRRPLASVRIQRVSGRAGARCGRASEQSDQPLQLEAVGRVH